MVVAPESSFGSASWLGASRLNRARIDNRARFDHVTSTNRQTERSSATFLRSARHGEELPGFRNALELVLAPVLEPQAAADHQIGHRPADKNLSGSSQR